MVRTESTVDMGVTSFGGELLGRACGARTSVVPRAAGRRFRHRHEQRRGPKPTPSCDTAYLSEEPEYTPRFTFGPGRSARIGARPTPGGRPIGDARISRSGPRGRRGR